MTEHESSRTLLKSMPELWTECSDAGALTRHLAAFGEIRITRLEPETTVAWEGTAARGTVRLETSGWGTRVTLSAAGETAAAAPAVDPPAEAHGGGGDVSPPASSPQKRPPRSPGLLRRLRERQRRRSDGASDASATSASELRAEGGADQTPAPSPDEALAAALDSLGGAHRRTRSVCL